VVGKMAAFPANFPHNPELEAILLVTTSAFSGI
jgi:hypothetical protein